MKTILLLRFVELSRVIPVNAEFLFHPFSVFAELVVFFVSWSFSCQDVFFFFMRINMNMTDRCKLGTVLVLFIYGDL